MSNDESQVEKWNPRPLSYEAKQEMALTDNREATAKRHMEADAHLSGYYMHLQNAEVLDLIKDVQGRVRHLTGKIDLLDIAGSQEESINRKLLALGAGIVSNNIAEFAEEQNRRNRHR